VGALLLAFGLDPRRAQAAVVVPAHLAADRQVLVLMF
jgi:hypothetical protein